MIALTDWLTERHRACDCPVVLIDEAQSLTNTALEDLRMLLNLEVDGVKLVQIVLAGHDFVEQCMEWLSKPMGKASVEAPTLHRAARSLRSWLLRPMSSTTVPAHRQREASARLKNS